ncbi:transcriptional regulator [Treponema medium]|uniref:transcriptional regulator n=1 Tax=Treponema medium TaxID=58231 RepID=UPI001AF188FC|nr:transcriptional regulator [Treponema medium]QSH93098.1 transcriptional regulator [Treponema medium]
MQSDAFRFQAQEDFSKARNKAWINEMQNVMHPDKKRLLSLNDVKKILKPKNEVYVGLKTVPINKIVGSEGRYNDFDNRFLPRSNELKQRWVNVDQAHLSDIVLPPIQLYELGGLYFVRDGNHRVSVAKTQGVEFIDAEVISLQSEVQLPPDVRLDTLLTAVIRYEKRVFYNETHFGDLTDYWDLDFTAAGRYDVIYNHILVHKYYMNEQQHTEIDSCGGFNTPTRCVVTKGIKADCNHLMRTTYSDACGGVVDFSDALISWFKTVYLPVIAVIDKYKLLSDFKDRTKSDIYVWIVKHWDRLKQKNGNDFSLDDAARDFVELEKRAKAQAPSALSKLKAKFLKLFKK